MNGGLSEGDNVLVSEVLLVRVYVARVTLMF